MGLSSAGGVYGLDAQQEEEEAAGGVGEGEGEDDGLDEVLFGGDEEPSAKSQY